ncbi:AGAP012672-PA-like protein [Anopheles sinensis]|uniref:AGAP012672-PA-like protein n=1 Tax=Anopheles sinensis TaxID=74873 RepID=A0A084VP89_ANOSI|nr:AGAP012672-PA-like protein [Anopheles sinensis]
MSFEYIEINDPLYVENKDKNGEDDFIMVRAKECSDVPISIPDWQPVAHCFTTRLDVSLIHDTKISSFERVRQTPRPRFIKTHLPVSYLPKSYWKVKPKTVYIRRNPKSVAISYFHHSRGIFYKGTMENFLQSFMREHHFYSPYHAHVIEYHELQGCDNVLYLSYEEMKQDLRSVIGRVCAFFGKSYSDAELQQLVDHLSFESMRENSAVNYEDPNVPRIDGSRFMRKGQLASWKEELSPEMIKALDQWTVQNVPKAEHRHLFE